MGADIVKACFDTEMNASTFYMRRLWIILSLAILIHAKWFHHICKNFYIDCIEEVHFWKRRPMKYFDLYLISYEIKYSYLILWPHFRLMVKWLNNIFSWYLHSIIPSKRTFTINVISSYLNVQLWWHCWSSSKQDIGCVDVSSFEERNGLQDILLCTQFTFLDSPIIKILLNIPKAFHEGLCTCLDLVTPVTFKSSYEIRGYHNSRDK